MKTGAFSRYIFFLFNLLIFLAYGVICRYLYADIHVPLEIISKHLLNILLVYLLLVLLAVNFILGRSLITNPKSFNHNNSYILLVNIGIFLTSFAVFFIVNKTGHLLVLSAVYIAGHFIMLVVLDKANIKGEASELHPKSEAEKAVSKLGSFCSKYSISPREKEVIELICEGCTNKEIAKSLFITLQTVKDHTHRIYTKVGVKNRVQLIKEVNK